LRLLFFTYIYRRIFRELEGGLFQMNQNFAAKRDETFAVKTINNAA